MYFSSDLLEYQLLPLICVIFLCVFLAELQASSSNCYILLQTKLFIFSLALLHPQLLPLFLLLLSLHRPHV